MRALLVSSFLLFALYCSSQLDSTYSFLEQRPKFPGGDTALMSFIGKNVTYPEYERTHNIGGKVILRFVVDIDGSVRNIEVIKSISLGLDREAVRVIKLLPKFAPGKQDGKPVKAYFSVPVRFVPPPQETSFLVPFKSVEVNPKFPGGDAALMHFIQENLRYPEDAISRNIQGKVQVRFVVLEDGSVAHIQILRSVDPILDDEAVRVVRLLPKFIPGIHQNKPVPVYFNLPIVFKLARANVSPDTSYVFPSAFLNSQPQFPGGEHALTELLNENMKYPEGALQKGIKGKVGVTFVIGTDGSVSDVHISKSLDPDLDAEAIRLIKLLPKFQPGLGYAGPVKTYYNQIVKFRLPKKNKN